MMEASGIDGEGHAHTHLCCRVVYFTLLVDGASEYVGQTFYWGQPILFRPNVRKQIRLTLKKAGA